MKKQVRKILIVILALVFLGSLAALLRQQQIYRTGEDIYTRAEQLAQQPPAALETLPTPDAAEQTARPSASDSPAEALDTRPQSTAQPKSALESLSIASLRQVSPDVVGWIKIPDTALSYPLVQGTDNDFYLNHAWDATATAVGSIFMDWRCAADLTDFHTVIYGHRMRDGSMFNSLRHYSSPSYREEHPYVYIKIDAQVLTYAVFAAYEAPVRSPVYDLTPPDAAAKQTLIDFALAQSVIDTGVLPTVNDRILTLSTCTGNGYDTRWVVQAVQLPNGGQE